MREKMVRWRGERGKREAKGGGKEVIMGGARVGRTGKGEGNEQEVFNLD